MSYIIENSQPLLLMKLTSVGRKAIASGNLDFKYWSVGDSEVDYRFNDIITDLERNPDFQQVLRPKDKNPNLKTYPCSNNCEQVLVPFSPTQITVEECCVRNEANSRGFFLGNKVSSSAPNTYTIDPTLAITTGTIQSTQLNGSNVIDIGTLNYTIGDYILFKVTNSTLGNIPLTETIFPVPYIWMQITNDNISTIVELDRLLPDYSAFSAVPVDFFIFPYANGNSILNYYGNNQISPYWNSETLEFTYPCDITSGDVRVWNFNAVWNEEMVGLQSGYQGFLDFGSMDFIGEKEYYGYNLPCDDEVDINNCQDKLNSIDDKYVRGIGIIHYTNNNPSNEYGEHFYIDHPNFFFRLSLPTIMWHRRALDAGQLDLGMEFRSDGLLKYVENSNIPYYDLVENSSLIDSGLTPISVGRVFPTLKTVTIHNQELLAVMSYKSNRNWTLPKIKGKMRLPTNGIGFGVLPVQKTIYLTYVLEANHGVRYTLPHQHYIKYINTGNIDRDVDFTIESINYLRYMQQIEQPTYSGFGFYAHKFKILAQVVDIGQRPNPALWREIDFTSVAITNVAGYTINPLLLERQSADANFFVLTKQLYDNAPIYDLSTIGIPQVCCPEVLNFGDERFCWGNIDTWIGACIYRTRFRIDISGINYDKSINPTWTDGDDFIITELAVYNDKKEMVAICKLSRPIKLLPNRAIRIGLDLDF